MRKKVVAALGAIAVVGGLAVAGSSAEAASCAPGPTDPNTDCSVQVSAVVGTGGLTGVRTLGSVSPVRAR
jgi:hypothetical protein